MGEPHPDLTRPPTHLSITSHLSHTLPLKHLCNWPPLYPPPPSNADITVRSILFPQGGMRLMSEVPGS